ncbi:MAG: 3-coathanger stack domain-containing protein [Saprospiraceae bacterium]
MKMRISFLMGIALLLIIPKWSTAQAYVKAVNPDSYNGNFRELAKKIDMFYDTATGSNRGGYKLWKRGEWFAMHHLDENGKLGNYLQRNIEIVDETNLAAKENYRMAATGAWINIGHSSIPGSEAKMGRVNSVAFDPVNSAIIYVASAAGGIWKSTNNGDTWTNLTIDLPILGIADIVVSPAPNNNIVYALTGDLAGSGVNIYEHLSVGVIKSYNGGLSWTRTNLTVPLSQKLGGYKLLMHPSNPNILYAAMTDGIHRTLDGGSTWNNIAPVGSVNDIEFNPSNLNILYYTKINDNNFNKINLTTLAISSIGISTFLNIDRMEIAVTPDNPNAVYLLAGPGYLFIGANLFNGLFYSGNSGTSFVQRSISCNDNGDLFNSGSSFSYYANTIYVDPFEENYVIVGGLNLFNSINGGVTLNQITFNSIHSDQHNIKRNPINGHLWLCNDGGVYRSTNSGNTWENKSNGLAINEYYRLSGTNNVEDRLLGGTQDNGHFLRNAGGDFQFVMGGDGMDNYFNSLDNNIAYACSQNAGLQRSTNAGVSFNGSTLPNAGDKNFYPWISPIIQHPPFLNPQSGQWENTDVIYVYSLAGIMRSTDGATWTNIGPANIGQFSGSLCPSMTICRDVGGTILYVTNGNNFWRCSNPLDNAPSWTNAPLPINNTTYVSAIAVNPFNKNEVWATISGYQAGLKVFRTLNAGVSWSNVSFAIPNTPIYSIVFANNNNNPSGAVYVGTETGVYYKNDGLPNWVPFSNGLPHVPVTDLQMNYVTNELKCSTYGRGIWKTSVYDNCPSSVHVNYEINQGQYNFEASTIIYAYDNITGGIGTRVTMKAGDQIRLQNGFRANQDTYVRIAIGGCATGPLGLTGNEPNPQKERK